MNTLQQLQNIASYTFLHPKLLAGDVKLNALWFDRYTGDFYMFSREKERFVEVNEDHYNHLCIDGESYEDKHLIAKQKKELLQAAKAQGNNLI